MVQAVMFDIIVVTGFRTLVSLPLAGTERHQKTLEEALPNQIYMQLDHYS